MKVAILLNRRRARLRSFVKDAMLTSYRVLASGGDESFLPPEYDSFARVLDDSPVVLGTGDAIDWRAVEGCDLLVWEWGWSEDPPRRVIEIKRRTGLRVLMFPGPLDRFWRELDLEKLPAHVDAMHATDAVGVMLSDTEALYRGLMPHAQVFHMPVPVDVAAIASSALPRDRRRRDRLLLTAPSRFSGVASQLPIATHVAFRLLRDSHPGLSGLCFAYGAEELAQARVTLNLLGLGDRIEVAGFVRPIFRFLARIRDCAAGLFLPNGLLQGRTAMVAACLGLPMVVSEEIETHRTLFPATSVRWFDVAAAATACARLLEDRDFNAEVVRHAREKVVYYSVENCRQRMLDALSPLATRRAVGAWV